MARRGFAEHTDLTSVAGHQLHARWMIRGDLKEVLDIEAQGFGKWAWTEDGFMECLRERNKVGQVVEVQNCKNKVVGYCIRALHRGNYEIINIAVAPEFRRQGVASLLLTQIKNRLGVPDDDSVVHRDRIEAMVSDGNLGAHLLLRSQGFKAVEVRRRYYEDIGADGYLFRFNREE